MKRRHQKNILIGALVAVLALFTISAQGQQTAQAYRWVNVVPLASLGDQAIPADAAIDGIVFADNGAFAAVVRWVAAGANHVELITQNSAINAGEIVDRQRIVDIHGGSLSINRLGIVAYEAVYSDPAAGGAIGTGIFANGRFVQRLDAATGDASDFTLTDDGKLILKLASSPTPAQPKGTDVPKAPKGPMPDVAIPPAVQKQIENHLPPWMREPFHIQNPRSRERADRPATSSRSQRLRLRSQSSSRNKRA
jgi:hypothetical protein